METYFGYKPVKILDTFVKIYGQQVHYHKSREEYSIERYHPEDDQSHLAPFTLDEVNIFRALLEFEKCVRDAQDRHDDNGKEMGRQPDPIDQATPRDKAEMDALSDDANREMFGDETAELMDLGILSPDIGNK